MPVTFSILRSDEVFCVKLHNYYEQNNYAHIFQQITWKEKGTRVDFSHGSVSIDNSKSDRPFNLFWGSPVIADGDSPVLITAFNPHFHLGRMHIGATLTIRLTQLDNAIRPSGTRIVWPATPHMILGLLLAFSVFFCYHNEGFDCMNTTLYTL